MILIAIISLGGIGAAGAVLLYATSKKFEVYEDPRISEVQQVLPAANCGGCGYPGCSGFANACVKADNLDNLFCPVGGAAVMSKVAGILGKEVVKTDPTVAVVRCNGLCEARPRTNQYDGASSCMIASTLYGGETGCSFGCLGLGDCELACDFDAIHINPTTRLPEVIEDKCTSCGACVKACPKMIIELRKKGPKSRRIFVSCVNKDKGGVARKACTNACIGCSKCEKECAFDAIKVENNLAYIDPVKCRLCRKCVVVCPTGAIHELNFPPRKEKEAVPTEKAAKPAEKVATPIAKGTDQTEKATTPIVKVADQAEKTTVVPAEKKTLQTEKASDQTEKAVMTMAKVADPVVEATVAPTAENKEQNNTNKI